jgi:hypothetical protein
LKYDTREAAIHARHQRALAAARRQAELAAANTGALPSGAAMPIPAAQVDGRESELTVVPAKLVAVTIEPDDAEHRNPRTLGKIRPAPRSGSQRRRPQ